MSYDSLNSVIYFDISKFIRNYKDINLQTAIIQFKATLLDSNPPITKTVRHADYGGK